MKFGRKRSKLVHAHLVFAMYRGDVAIMAPASLDLSAKAMASLSNIFDNDTLGDCVIAGGAHITGVATGNAGSCFVATNDQILAQYSAIGGYVPGDPSTDQGCDESAAISYWQMKGFADGTMLLGSMKVNPSNATEIRDAIFLTENLMFGMALPNAWVSPFPSGNGFVWDVAGDPNPDNGHCVIAYGYNSQGVLIDSWGMLGTITWAAIAKYCDANAGGELWALLTPDSVAKGQTVAPNGLAWDDILSDFGALGGSVISKPPAPKPAPTPETPTLEKCKQAIDAALDEIFGK